jgi:hypothetical protein
VTLEAKHIEALARCISKNDDCATIESLYRYLDVIDRKTASLITLNSFLTPIATFFVFRPLGLFEPNTATLAQVETIDRLVLFIGGAALFVSFVTISRALSIFSIKWAYLYYARKDDGYDLPLEIPKLAEETARRQYANWWIWIGTFAAVVLNFLAIALTAAGQIKW